MDFTKLDLTLEKVINILFKKISHYCKDAFIKEEVVATVLLELVDKFPNNIEEAYEMFEKMVFFTFTKYLRNEKAYTKYKALFRYEAYESYRTEIDVAVLDSLQSEVAERLMAGKSIKEVSSELKISEKTLVKRSLNPSRKSQKIQVSFVTRELSRCL